MNEPRPDPSQSDQRPVQPDSAVAPLAYYATIGAALFPIPAGSKAPTGIVRSFVTDNSPDPAQWERWRTENPGCNFGIVAGPSRLIIVDIDTNESRDEAWAAWCELCTTWGIPPASPHVQSARGGWHVYFAVPADVDAATLRQPDAIKNRINVRAGNGYTVAAGSVLHVDGDAESLLLPYVLLSAEPPYPAPAALLAHCTCAAAPASAPNLGTRDIGDVANLIRWLAERDAFTAYEDWVGVGMALKIEFGDDGLPLWESTTWPDALPDVPAKWASFATDPAPGVQTLNSWLDRAHKLGWRGNVRRSTSAMFDGVATLARNAGATLPGGMPMMAGQEALCRIAEPIVNDFLALPDLPLRPNAIEYPQIPDVCSGHGLFDSLRQAVDRIIAVAEKPKTFRAQRIIPVMAVLSLVHQDTADAVIRRINMLGATLSAAAVKRATLSLQDQVERTFIQQDNWFYSIKGEIEHDNSDNVAVFLGILGIEIRWNAWLERAEIRGGLPLDGDAQGDAPLYFPDWTYIDDGVVAKLRTRANRTKTRFRPAKEFFWESLFALAAANTVDPARDHLDALAAAWDSKPRLSIWLTRACNTPCDPYHQAVGRNIIGGIVRRIRSPGCKHDTMPVFYGPQGTGKSTLAALLAGRAEWFTDTVLLGDASKELVLSLAGKSVVEIGEMGMRGAANPNHVKAMISRQVDAGRTAYARTVTERPRRNIFIGTTNDDEPLVDPTGNRRFLPVHVEQEIDLPWIRANVDQLLGEAAVLDAAGTDFTLPRAVWAVAAAYQEAARSESDIEIRFAEWFAPTDMLGNAGWIASHDLAELANLAGWRATNVRGAIMKQLGFRKELATVDGKRLKVWVRGPDYMRPTDVTRLGVRYRVGLDSSGRVRVTVTAPADGGTPTAPVARGAAA